MREDQTRFASRPFLLFFVWGVVARLLEKKSRPFLIKQRVVSVESLCVVFVKNLIVVLKRRREFYSLFQNKTNQKKRRQKKSRREIIRFAKSL
jgi:hypothetical protein